MRGRKAAVIAAAATIALLLSAGVAVGAGAQGAHTVKTEGRGTFVPNGLVQETLHFWPGNISVKSGGSLTWVASDKSGDPHTISIVTRADWPKTLNQVFHCGARGTICRRILKAQFPKGQPPLPVVNVGPPGLDEPGDSLLIAPGHPNTAIVSAPPGTVLYYMCAIHPWMQGTITVTG